MLSINYIVKELLAEKTRLLLTVLAIAWGTASITGMLAVGEGLRITFGRAMSNVGKSILVVQGGQTSTSYQGQSINLPIDLTQQDFNSISQSIPNIQITPEYTFNTTLRYKKYNSSNAFVNPVEPIYRILRNIEIAKGRFINPLDDTSKNRVAVLGAERAKRIFSNKQDPIGQTIYIGDQPFKVIGVAKKKMQLWSYQYPDNYLVWIPKNTYIAIAHPTTINFFIIVPNDANDFANIKQQITKLIALNHHVDPNDQKIVNFRDSYQQQKKTSQVFGGMEIFLGIIGTLTLMVAGVGIANVMFISVRRSTREIGIRMAIGAKTYQILIHYIVESLLTTAVGGIIGLVVAKIIVALVNLLPLNGGFFAYIGKPSPVISTSIVMTVILILGIIGLLSGFFPARKAAHINPAEALRYE